MGSRVAQWKRAGPITQRSEDQNLALLKTLLFFIFFLFCIFFWNLHVNQMKLVERALLKLRNKMASGKEALHICQKVK